MEFDVLTESENILIELGEKLRFWLISGGADGSWEGTQFKAKADTLAHEFLVSRLKKLDSSISIISEEDTDSLTSIRPDKYWLIDPIDGTASYVGGFSGYVCQIALMEHGRPILSAVYAPELKLLYSAEIHKGARLNGNLLPRITKRPSKILIDNYPEPRGIASRIYNGLKCNGYVESGSLGLKLLRVADGTADLFVKDVIVKDWDLAPADLILSELGIKVSDINGSEIVYDGTYDIKGIICARTSELKQEFLDFVKDKQ